MSWSHLRLSLPRLLCSSHSGPFAFPCRYQSHVCLRAFALTFPPACNTLLPDITMAKSLIFFKSYVFPQWSLLWQLYWKQQPWYMPHQHSPYRSMPVGSVALVMSDSLRPHQAPVSMAFSRQWYWSGLPCPPPGDLPDPGNKSMSPALQANSLPPSHQGNPSNTHIMI